MFLTDYIFSPALRYEARQMIFSQLYDVEISEHPLQRTEKQTIKRYLYK